MDDDEDEIARTLGRHIPWRDNHPRDKHSICPACQADCNRVALVDLVYAFEPCDCPTVSYTHLVERLWHRTCIKAAS